jgi:hypothetical protein
MANLLSKLRITEVSSVDRGAGEGVKVMLMKREGDAVPGKRNPISKLLRKMGFLADPDKDAKTLEEALNEQSFWDQYYKATSALQESLCSILKDEDATDKEGMINESLKQFSDYIEKIIPDQIGKALTAGIAANAGAAGNDKGHAMSDAIKKALGLAATATDADMTAALTKRDEDAKVAIEALAKANTEIAMLKMSDGHKKYMADTSMSDDAKAKFAAKTADERDAHIKDNPVEKNLPESVVKALKDAEDTKKRLEVLEAAAQTDVLRKRATELGLPETEVDTLRKARQGDVASVEKLENLLKAAQAQVSVGKAFAEFGSKDQSGGASATDQLKAKAAELVKGDPALTKEKAYAKAFKDPANAELVAQVKREERAAKAAA